MVAQHEKEMKELGDVIYAMDLRYDERETDSAHGFQSLMDELKNKVCNYVTWVESPVFHP